MPKQSIIPIFVPHIGCPNMCVFCNQHRISGHTGIPDVAREIESALPKCGDGAQVAFYGGSFTAIDAQLQESLLSCAYEYVLMGKISSMRVSTRPDCIDEVRVERLKKYAVDTVELGVQSLDENVLLMAKRGHDVSCVKKAVEILRKAGIKIILQMMTGLPGDTGKESIETAEKIIGLKPDGVRIYPTVVLPKTELADMLANGRYSPQSLDNAVELCSEISGMFERAEVPVIRIGLNPGRDLDDSVIAGAYHPALGEMVLSRRMLKKAVKLIENLESLPERLTIGVNSRKISAMVGQKKENTEFLKNKFGIKSIKIIPVDIPENGIIIVD